MQLFANSEMRSAAHCALKKPNDRSDDKSLTGIGGIAYGTYVRCPFWPQRRTPVSALRAEQVNVTLGAKNIAIEIGDPLPSTRVTLR